MEMLEATNEGNRGGLDAAVDMLAQQIDAPMADLKDKEELQRAMDRDRVQQAVTKAVEKSEKRIMKLVSGMLECLSKEGKHREETARELKLIRRIVHKNGSAAEDMAGGLRELTGVLRGNGRKKEEEEEEEEEEQHRRNREGRAPSPEHYIQPKGFFNEWTEEQKEEYIKRNPLRVSWKGAEGCEVLQDTGGSPAVSLPSRLSSVILTPTPRRVQAPVDSEQSMPGAYVQSEEVKGEKAKREVKSRVVETDSEESSTDGEEINKTEVVKRWKSGVRVEAPAVFTAEFMVDPPRAPSIASAKSTPIPMRVPEAAAAKVIGPLVNIEATKMATTAVETAKPPQVPVIPAVPQVVETDEEKRERRRKAKWEKYKKAAMKLIMEEPMTEESDSWKDERDMTREDFEEAFTEAFIAVVETDPSRLEGTAGSEEKKDERKEEEEEKQRKEGKGKETLRQIRTNTSDDGFYDEEEEAQATPDWSLTPKSPKTPAAAISKTAGANIPQQPPNPKPNPPAGAPLGPRRMLTGRLLSGTKICMNCSRHGHLKGMQNENCQTMAGSEEENLGPRARNSQGEGTTPSPERKTADNKGANK